MVKGRNQKSLLSIIWLLPHVDTHRRRHHCPSCVCGCLSLFFVPSMFISNFCFFYLLSKASTIHSSWVESFRIWYWIVLCVCGWSHYSLQIISAAHNQLVESRKTYASILFLSAISLSSRYTRLNYARMSLYVLSIIQLISIVFQFSFFNSILLLFLMTDILYFFSL